MNIKEYDIQKVTTTITTEDALTWSYKVTTDKKENSDFYTSLSFVATISYNKYDILEGDLYVALTVYGIERYSSSYISVKSPVQKMALAKISNLTTFTVSCPSFYMDEEHNLYKYANLRWEPDVSFIGSAYNKIYY